jgi:hypothetical protein
MKPMGLRSKLNEIVPDREADVDDLKYRRYVRYADGIAICRYNSDWFISDKGDLYNNEDYCIPRDRLAEPDWFLHLMEKGWFNANTFLPAYFEACRRNHITKLTVLTDYA